MGVLPIVLMILAMKIPILGLIWFAWWAAREPETENPGEEKARDQRPRRPDPGRPGRPRRRGPHGGGAVRPAPAAEGGRAHASAPALRPLRARRN